MKILVISDTHGEESNVLRVLEQEGQPDLLIHCGDVQDGETYIRDLCRCPCVFVQGNNDFYSNFPGEQILEIDGHRILVTHGHRYRVSFSTKWLESAAKNCGAQIVMFGHTHYPALIQKDGLTLLNPGSLTYPRQRGRKPAFLLMETYGDGQIRYTQKYLDEEENGF